jgi:hypothetical protein
MSSPTLLASADCRAPLLAALTDVAENSLFAFADVSDADRFDDAVRDPVQAGSRWLTASIPFHGSASGRFALTIPETLARRLCASFAGADSIDEIHDGDLFDFSGELANMVCGAWLTRASRHEVFSLRPPRVARTDPDVLADPGADRVYLSIDDVPIRLDVSLSPAGAEGGADGR